MELVTGASGYVGGRLIDRLFEEGRPVRALARRPELVEPRAGVEVVQGDLLDPASLGPALDGVESAYYLVHSMAPAANGSDFASVDRLAADNFAAAARAAGVERAVYLGGLVPEGGPRSTHLASRLEVEDILLDALPGSTALRASIVVGAQSSSFRLLVRLVERLRVLPFPGWRDNRTQPIDERDAIEYLARTPGIAAAAGRSFDIVGPDLMTYGEMIKRIAEGMGVGRTPLLLNTSQTPSASAVVAAVTGMPIELVRPLMESLESDLLPRNDDASTVYGLKPRHFDRAVTHALAEWEETEVLAAR